MKNIVGAFFSGAKSSVFSTLYKSLIQLVQLIILTRLLSHEDFGIFAIVTICVNFAKIYMDFGVTNSIIQERNPSHTLLSSLFWINILSGLAISLLVYFISAPISNYYNAEDVRYLMEVMSAIFFIYSLSNLHRALMKKYFNFGKLALADCLSLTFSFLTTTIAAYNGEGVWSFAYGAIVHSITSSILVIIFSWKYLTPSFIVSFRDSTSSLKFGLYQLGQNTTIFATTQVDVIIIGKLLGLEVLGAYNILKQYLYMLSQVVNPIIGNVIYPILSSVNNNHDKLDRLSSQVIKYTFVLNVSFFGIFISFSDFICNIILEAPGYSIVLVLLAIYFAMRSFLSPLGVLLLSKGKANVAFSWSVMELILITIFCYFGASESILYLSISLILYQSLMTVLSWVMLVSKYTSISVTNYINCFTSPCLIFLFSYVISVWLSKLPLNEYFVFSVSFAVYLFIYIILTIMFNFELKSFIKAKVGNK